MKRYVLLTFMLIGLVSAPVSADEQPAESSPWSGSLGLAYVATSGNSDTQTLGLELKGARKPEPWGLELSAAFTRADQDGELTAERYFAGFRGKRSVGERWELFAGASGEKDRLAGFDLRTVLETGATVKALVGPTHNLAFSGGLTWTREDYVEMGPSIEDSYDYVGAVLSAVYGWKISETSSFDESLVWYPNFDVSSDWRLTSETALKAALSSRLALKLAHLVRYDNEPIPGFDDTDTTTSASLVVSF